MSTIRPRFRWNFAPGICFLMVAGGCGSSVLMAPADAATDAPAADAPAHDAVGDAACSAIADEYQAAVTAAKECTTSAVGQCQVQARSSFWCNCTTIVNGDADKLSAIAARYQAAGCFNVCNGTCVQVQTEVCQADSTSATGGRCQPANLHSLDSSQSGGALSVAVGDEIDITLGAVGPGSYSTTPQLSSDGLTIIEITIPAGAPNPGGVTRLYRLRATAAGAVTVQIPFDAAAGGPTKPPFTVTITVN